MSIYDAARESVTTSVQQSIRDSVTHLEHLLKLSESADVVLKEKDTMAIKLVLKSFSDSIRHNIGVFQDACEGAWVQSAYFDALRQALHEVSPNHPALAGEPPSYGVWEKLRSDLNEAQQQAEELKRTISWVEAQDTQITTADTKRRFIGCTNLVALVKVELSLHNPEATR